MGCRMNRGKVRILNILIFVLAALAAPFWPEPLGLILMALAFFGVIHQSVLIHELIAEEKIRHMNPYDYERYCAKLLMKNNWRTALTKASHDQGADIIATKRELRIVLQCKKYTKPIGNHAVQQVVAAIAHEDADRGIVVATTPFTSAARKLAESNNVLLLHHNELSRVDRLLRLSRR